jgi:DNA polymerase III delta' subunit
MAAATETTPLGLTELFGKELQSGMLLSALRRDRLGGTLLLHGADGSGKSSVAFWLAAAFNCATGGGTTAPCGECASCRKIAGLGHPDVYWVFPLPGAYYSGGAPDEGKLEELYVRKRANPARAVEFSEKAEHHIASVARIRHEAARSCYEGRRKVFVVTHADRLRQEAANAFLKLLEEPRRDVTIILCTARPSSLLPTIISRCQRMQFTRPPQEIVVSLLEQRYGIENRTAARLARLSSGDISSALALADQGELESQREWVEKTFAAVLAPGELQVLELLDDRKSPFYNRGDFERYAALLAEALRDVLLAIVAERRPDSPQVESFRTRVADSRSLVKLIESLINLGDSLNRNVNLRLLGWSLLNDMKEVIGE